MPIVFDYSNSGLESQDIDSILKPRMEKLVEKLPHRYRELLELTGAKITVDEMSDRRKETVGLNDYPNRNIRVKTSLIAGELEDQGIAWAHRVFREEVVHYCSKATQFETNPEYKYAEAVRRDSINPKSITTMLIERIRAKGKAPAWDEPYASLGEVKSSEWLPDLDACEEFLSWIPRRNSLDFFFAAAFSRIKEALCGTFDVRFQKTFDGKWPERVTHAEIKKVKKEWLDSSGKEKSRLEGFLDHLVLHFHYPARGEELERIMHYCFPESYPKLLEFRKEIDKEIDHLAKFAELASPHNQERLNTKLHLGVTLNELKAVHCNIIRFGNHPLAGQVDAFLKAYEIIAAGPNHRNSLDILKELISKTDLAYQVDGQNLLKHAVRQTWYEAAHIIKAEMEKKSMGKST